MLVLLTWNPIRHMISDILAGWIISIDGWELYQQLLKDIRSTQPKEQLILSLAALLCYHQLSPPALNDFHTVKESYQADFDAILNGESLSNSRTLLEKILLSVSKTLNASNDEEEMRLFLAGIIEITQLVPDTFLRIFRSVLDMRSRDEKSHENTPGLEEKRSKPAKSGNEELINDGEGEIQRIFTAHNERKQIERSVLMETNENQTLVEAQQTVHRLSAFPEAVLHLRDYKLVYVCLPTVPPCEKILSAISLPNGLSAVVVLGSYIVQLERDLNIQCFPYNLEPSREDSELLGSTEAQNRVVEMLARMAVESILSNDTSEKKLWICADPVRVLKLFKIWLQGIASNSMKHCAQSGRIQLDGYDFNLYTLVWVSDLGHWRQNLDQLANFDDVLSLEELHDGSWELPVRKSYLPNLEDKIRKVVPDCIFKSEYDPTEPTEDEIEIWGYETSRNWRVSMFCKRVERMMQMPLPKAAAFYSDLTMGDESKLIVLQYDDIELDEFDKTEVCKVKGIAEENLCKCCVMVEALQI